MTTHKEFPMPRSSTRFSVLFTKVRQYLPAGDPIAMSDAVRRMLAEELEEMPEDGTLRITKADAKAILFALSGYEIVDDADPALTEGEVA